MNPINSLSKDTILNNTTAESIFKFYLQTENINKNLSSPFSNDKKPSFRAYKNGTFKCNSTGKQGDVFQFVADLKNLDCKKDFPKVLQTIQDDLNLIINVNNPITKEVQLKKENIANHKLNIIAIEMNQKHLDFWQKLGVQKELLQKYNVFAISNYNFFSTEKNKRFSFDLKDEIAFAYKVNDNFEVYKPAQNNKEKIFNRGLANIDVFGLDQIKTKVDNLIICAGKKDVLVAVSRGFNAITFQSETYYPKKEQIEFLKSLCDNLFICYDNDTTGIKFSNKIISTYNEIINIELPKNEIKGFDIADYFQKYSKEDFQELINLAVKNKNFKVENPTIFHIVENYLLEKYDIRFNTISLDIEISKKGLNDYTICNENSLWIEVQKNKMKIGINGLIAILKSDFVKHYNPIHNYFECLSQWDKQTDYITEYSRYIKLNINEDKEQFEYNFKKWCVRAVKTVFIDDYFNKQAFVLSDDGKSQNAGKTSWINNLCPSKLHNYLTIDLPKDEKDQKISVAKNFLINLDELANLSKQDVNGLKSLFSLPKIKVRLPYDKKDSVIQRICSFIGSTNNSTFLSDETGSVRWLCFVLDTIDWSYRENFNIDNLWSQAYYLANDNSFDETMTKEDIVKNERRNEKFQIVTPEKELIMKCYEPSSYTDHDEKYTSTEVLLYISSMNTSIRLTPVQVGKALNSLKYEKSRIKDIHCYKIAKKEGINP